MKTIYQIKNKLNNNIYIGQTSDLNKRIENHLITYERNPEDISWDSPLYKEMREQGIDSFTFEPIETTPKEKAYEREQFWIKKLNTLHPNGYNLTSGGEQGKQYSELTKERIGKTTKERWEDPDIANRMKGGLSKAGIKKGYIRVPREIRSCKECLSQFESLENSGQIYCSQKCALPDIRKKQKEVYMEERRSVHQEIKTYAEEWSIKNKEIVANCPYNRIKTNLKPLIEEITKTYDVKDYRVISKAISGQESRKSMLEYLKKFVK